LFVPIAHWRLVVVSATEVLGASDPPWGVTGVEVADTGPQLSDSTRSLLQDLVVCSADVNIPKSAYPSDAAPVPGSSSTMSPGRSGLYLPGFPGSLPPPINWRQLEDEAESVCS
jgi:hypothetical protein